MTKSDLLRNLCLAIDKEDVETAKKLIAQGSDVNGTSRATADSTLLWMTVNLAGQEISKSFRDLGDGLSEYLNLPRRDYAVKREEHLRSLKLLIELKADVNKLSHGSTPLRIAVHSKDLEVVEFLLSNGANPNAETFTILSKLAKKVGRRILPGYWNTVLHEAVLKNSLPIVQALVEAGADTKRTDHEGKTPLDLARKNGFSEIEAYLLKIVQN